VIHLLLPEGDDIVYESLYKYGARTQRLVLLEQPIFGFEGIVEHGSRQWTTGILGLADEGSSQGLDSGGPWFALHEDHDKSTISL
jgi:hypothetical protein